MVVFLSHAFGFYKAPFTKMMLGSVFLASCVIQLPFLNFVRKAITFNFVTGKPFQGLLLVGKCFVSQLAFIDIRSFILGTLLHYNFRIFEKRYGSRKYASYVFANLTLGILFESLFIYLVNTRLDETRIKLPSGPWLLVFSLYINYINDIPFTSNTRFLGFPITSKMFVFLIAFGILSSSFGDFIVAASGLLAGIFCRANLFSVCDWMRIPTSILDFFSSHFGDLIESDPPSEGFNGATLDIQRQQEIEQFENEAQFTMNEEELRQDPIFLEPENINETQTASSTTQVNNEELETHVAAMEEMGFDSQKARRALERAGNDIMHATGLLLDEAN